MADRSMAIQAPSIFFCFITTKYTLRSDPRHPIFQRGDMTPGPPGLVGA